MTFKSIFSIIWKITFLFLIDTVCAEETISLDEKGFVIHAICYSDNRPPMFEITTRLSSPANVYPTNTGSECYEQQVTSKKYEKIRFPHECFTATERIYSIFIEKTDLNPFYINQLETPLLYEFKVNCGKKPPVASLAGYYFERPRNGPTAAARVINNRQRSNSINKHGYILTAFCPSSTLPMEVNIQSVVSSVMYTMPFSKQECRTNVPKASIVSYERKLFPTTCFLQNEQIYSIFIEQNDAENPFYTKTTDEPLLFLYTLDCRSANPISTLKVADLEKTDIEPPSFIYVRISGQDIPLKISKLNTNGPRSHLATLGSLIHFQFINDDGPVHPILGNKFYPKNCNVTEDSFETNSLVILENYCKTFIARSIEWQPSYSSDLNKGRFSATLSFTTFALKSLNAFTVYCEVCSDSCDDRRRLSSCPEFKH